MQYADLGRNLSLPQLLVSLGAGVLIFSVNMEIFKFSFLFF